MVEEHVFREIPVTRSQIINCSFSSWYPKYKSHVPKSKIIKPLPHQFIDYLTSDGIQLPDDGHYQVNMGNGNDEYSDWSEDEDEETEQKLRELDSSSDESDEEDDKIQKPKKSTAEIFSEFQDIHTQIKDIIAEWGSITPKLNWSAPRDATWIMATNTMKCENASDVYLILNASNYIMHDISNAFDEVKEENNGVEGQDDIKSTQLEMELILRKWVSINPALEFRVFVKNRRIIGVSQRELNYYDYLENLTSTIRTLIDDFFENVLVDSFPDPDFVFDVYLPRPFDKTYLIDINPFSRTTDSQLFTWHELAGESQNKIDDVDDGEEENYQIRLVTEVNKGRFASKEHSENQVPKDVVDASLDSNAMAELAKQWKELQTKGGED
ncbi:hypothetical protein WICMUC_000085 [Wickerhamomyces mucosus]|uniref:Cell division cycle protein 123 n=1 Tax=Wickerhamomyces mucosus TaxID=1378264 RepID=A0A9P8PYL0_9ASCO|nr:hypothetical protein WICMUC_000085 [Wickerhamomyces mucosus]